MEAIVCSLAAYEITIEPPFLSVWLAAGGIQHPLLKNAEGLPFENNEFTKGLFLRHRPVLLSGTYRLLVVLMMFMHSSLMHSDTN